MSTRDAVDNEICGGDPLHTKLHYRGSFNLVVCNDQKRKREKKRNQEMSDGTSKLSLHRISRVKDVHVFHESRVCLR